KIREAAQLTQAQMAELLGVGQTSISRLEARPDMLLSTLRKFLDAAGATHPRILVMINGHQHEVSLDAFA
ncbi:MAG: helix-turn-helix domain-containing protein, partial [Actinobacteria bacterium]|nr:helix-turn-helix domain-containing protein [Actinomycetota bacterium]